MDTTKSPNEHGHDVATLEIFLRNFGGPNTSSKIQSILTDVTAKITE